MTRNALIAAAAALLLAACSHDGGPALQGYVEGVYVNVAAEQAGRLIERPVRDGDRVEAGAILFALDADDQAQAVAAAEARLAQGRAQLANLTTGKRDEEVAVIAADLNRARTNFTHAEDDLRRKLTLLEGGIVPQSVVDDARTTRDAALSTVEATERQLLVAQLPARDDEVTAAELNVAALEATLTRAQIALDKRTVRAPVAGLVAETYYEAGELVPASRTVVALLPNGNRKVRFFVPEPRLATITPGVSVTVGCDGCADDLTAVVDFVSREAEFTPPVIFSQETRDKLVFMAEARLAPDATLNVGQPVDVKLAGGDGQR